MTIRNARESAGFGQRELARRLGVSQPHLSFWESGHRIPKLEDVASLLACVGITGNERQRVLELARHAAEPNWIDVAGRGIPDALTTLVECERTATTLQCWNLGLIPGLLQTSDYARTILTNSPLTKEEAEIRLLARLARRDAISRRQPIQLTALIGETAIRNVIGTPAAMADQLKYLIDQSLRDNVAVRVVPTESGWHPGLLAPFLIYRFLDAPELVHVEHYRSSAFLYEDGLTKDYGDGFNRLLELARSETETRDLVADRVRELEASRE